MLKSQPIERPLALSQECRALGDQVIRAAVEMMNATKRHQPCHEVATLMLVRATDAMQSVEILASAGMNADATAIMRTVVEHEIDLAYILTENRDARFELFRDYPEMYGAENVEAVDRLLDREVDAELAKAIRKRGYEVAARRVELLGKDKAKIRNWAGVSLKARAESCGRGHTYALVYDEGCAASHSGAEGLSYCYSTTQDDSGRMNGKAFRVGRQEPSGRPIDWRSTRTFGSRVW
jgi:hypothetical protein